MTEEQTIGQSIVKIQAFQLVECEINRQSDMISTNCTNANQLGTAFGAESFILDASNGYLVWRECYDIPIHSN